METGGRIINADLINKLSSAGCKVSAGEPLSKHCSFRIGGAADYFIEIPSESALAEFLNAAGEARINYFILGGGTNILFGDKGFRGAVVKLTGDFEKIELSGENIICGAGASLGLVLKKAAENNLSGLECAAGIPGTAGGGVFGNAGNSKKWISDCVESLEVYKNEKKELINKEKIDFGYRTSGLAGCIILKIKFALKKEAENDILREVLENAEKRSKSQPLALPNAGCIFKNPPGLSAGKLIDDAGLKGKKKGGAEVSSAHGNFIVNSGGAKASDVLDLIYAVRRTVKEKFNLDLELEIKVID